MLQRFLFIALTLCSLTATAQWQQTGSKVRYVNGLGIPTKDTAAGVAADSSQIVIRPADSALYIKYKRTWLRVGGGGGSIAGSGTAGQVSFFTGASAIGGDSALFWDNTNKRLGIHTTNPGKNLDVHGTNVIAQFNGTGTNNAYLDFQRAGSTQWRIGNQYAAAVNRFSIFNAAGTTEHFTILQDGRVGVATPTPNTALQVGDGTGNPEITASGLNYDVVLGTPSGSALGFTTVGDYVGVYSNSATKDLAFTHGNSRGITFGTGNQTRLTITASGRLLANTRTDNGVDALQVAGSGRFSISTIGLPATSGTSQPNASLRLSSSATLAILDFGINSSYNWIQSTDRSNLSQVYNLLLNPNGGGVGVGTTSFTSGYQCDITGSIPLVLNSTSAASSSTFGSLNIRRPVNTVGNGNGLAVSMYNSASSISEYGYIGALVETNTAGAENGSLVFAPTSAAVRTIRGTMLSSGNFGLGYTDPAAKLAVSGTALINTNTDNGLGDKLQVNGSILSTQFKLSALNTAPATASSTGTLGEIRIDANYIYICTATNTWKRVAIATW